MTNERLFHLITFNSDHNPTEADKQAFELYEFAKKYWPRNGMSFIDPFGNPTMFISYKMKLGISNVEKN